MIPFIVLPISRLPNFAERTACTQMKGDNLSYVFSTSGFLCDIGEPRFRQNNTGYQAIKIVKYRLIPYS